MSRRCGEIAEQSGGDNRDSREMTPFTASDLPLDDKGRIYHLRLFPEQVAPDIIIVGDPGRAAFIGATFFRDITCEQEHRGLVSITGTAADTGEQVTVFGPLRTTVTTSGMGTPSLEVIVSELVALHEIDLTTRTRKTRFPRLHIIRVGTSGGLQASTKLGTPIITSYAVGLDNTGLFYEAPYADENCARLEGEVSRLLRDNMNADSRFYGKVFPYVARSEPSIVNALEEAAATLGVPTKTGLTVSASGFNAAQGRDIARLAPSAPDLDKALSEFDPMVGGQRVENMEMEASFLLHYLGGLGHWAGAICPAIANRRQDTFLSRYPDAIENAIRVALLALARTRNESPSAWIDIS